MTKRRVAQRIASAHPSEGPQGTKNPIWTTPLLTELDGASPKYAVAMALLKRRGRTDRSSK